MAKRVEVNVNFAINGKAVSAGDSIIVDDSDFHTLSAMVKFGKPYVTLIPEEAAQPPRKVRRRKSVAQKREKAIL